MKNMTVAEIKKMVGTEFKYVYGNRAEINAIVAAFDDKVGFTCLATELTDSVGYNYADQVDENGNYCVIGIPFDHKGFLGLVSCHLRGVKSMGYYKANSYRGFGFISGWGDASCSFS